MQIYFKRRRNLVNQILYHLTADDWIVDARFLMRDSSRNLINQIPTNHPDLLPGTIFNYLVQYLIPSSFRTLFNKIGIPEKVKKIIPTYFCRQWIQVFDSEFTIGENKSIVIKIESVRP